MAILLTLALINRMHLKRDICRKRRVSAEGNDKMSLQRLSRHIRLPCVQQRRTGWWARAIIGERIGSLQARSDLGCQRHKARQWLSLEQLQRGATTCRCVGNLAFKGHCCRCRFTATNNR